MTPRLALALAAPLAILLAACSDDHDHGSEEAHDHIEEAACEHASASPTAVTAVTDENATTPIADVGSGPLMVTIPAGETAYIWLRTLSDHADTGLFASQAGVVTGFEDPEGGTTYTLTDDGPPGECAEAWAADYRIHIHEAQPYRVTLDGNVATSVLLTFEDVPSDHAHAGE
ncbi:MAG: hypothetical protein KC635_10360 [Myxococcales bacterium]|nr:hypothetical protein [Myxococcales bacterium]MCB9731762.1 hypothetical protein [Deltaproteobacteria bacterium]